jgi:hypothetical protein
VKPLSRIVPQSGSRLDRWIVGAAAALAAWLFFGAALAPSTPLFSRQPSGYYGLQTAGFRAGHLYAAIAPHPELLALKDPYDPVANAPYRVHDMTLYGGHYYLYFGVTPSLIVFWPCAALTGWYPTEPCVVAAACTGAIWIGLALLVALRRRYYPDASPWALAWAAVCLFAANPMARLVESPYFYQVPISCAILLHLGMLAAVYRALHSERRALGWLAFASLLYGLAVGARPNHAASVLALVVAAGSLGRRAERGHRLGSAVRSLAVAALPAAACGGGLLWYNWLRFHSPFEFGMRYQLAGETFLNLKPIQLRNIWPHLGYYLFGHGFWSAYFPFFSAPSGQPYGFMRYTLWAWLAPIALLSAQSGEPAGTRRRAFTWALLAAVVGNLLLLMSFFGHTDRYPGEFACSWLLLSGVGALTLSQRATRRDSRRASNRVLGVLALASVGTALAALVAYAPRHIPLLSLARVANWPRYAWRSIRHENDGALRLELVLGHARTDIAEPVFATGRNEGERDWLEVNFLPGNRAQMAFFHAGLPGLLGDPFAIPVDRRLIVEARCGSLLPPFDYPAFSGWTRDEFATVKNDLQVRVNGVERLRAVVACYDTAPGNLSLGQMPWPTGGVANRVSGRFVGVERLPLDPKPAPLPPLQFPAPVELGLRLPAQHEAGGDPILVTGHDGQSDLLTCFYDGRGRIRFALDHYGDGGPKSDWMTYDPAQLHHLTVWMGALADPRLAPPPAMPGGTREIPWHQRLFVRFDGHILLNAEQRFYPGTPATTQIGRNPYGSTTAGERFEGQVTHVSQIPLEDLPPLVVAGSYGGVELKLKFPRNAYGTREPLVVSGVSGAGDLLYVSYLDSHHVAINLDHWGLGGLNGPPVEIDYAQPHRLSLTMGSLYPPGGDSDRASRVQVTIDGRVALTGRMRSHPSEPSQIRIGSNPIGGSTCGPAFTGQMLSVERLPLDGP